MRLLRALAKPRFIEPTNMEKAHTIQRIMRDGPDIAMAREILSDFETQNARLRHLRSEFDRAARKKHKIFGALHAHTEDQHVRPSPDRDRAAFAKWFLTNRCSNIGNILVATNNHFGLLRMDLDRIKHDLDQETRALECAVGFRINRQPNVPTWFDNEDQLYFDVCYLICASHLRRIANGPAIVLSIGSDVGIYETKLNTANSHLAKLVAASSKLVGEMEKILEN